MRSPLPAAAAVSALLATAALFPAPASAAKHAVLRTAAAACVRATASPRGVFAVGDSILAGGGRDLTARQASVGTPVCYDARVGRPIAEGIAVLRAQKRLPGTVVIALGTNDAFHVDAVPSEVADVMAIAGPARRVVWVDVYLQRPDRVEADAAATVQINSALVRAQARYHNLVVVDWASRVAQRPEWMQDDGMHPTALGSRVRNVTLGAALARGRATRR